jgi:hypothetical protein
MKSAIAGITLCAIGIAGVAQAERGALDYTAPNMFSGSLFDLQENTEYDVKLTLHDPDGVTGDTEKTLTVRTRAEPQPAQPGRVFHVYPPGYKGPKQQPAFSGLLEAYYMASLGGDWSRASPQPDFTDVTHVVAVDSVDLRLREGSKAIDAGVVLPNITDGYSGRAPDLGAYEYGAPLPHYGPRNISTMQGPTSARTTAR